MAAVPLLDEARIWDFREPAYVRVAAEVGDALYALGLTQFEQGAWDEAYRLFDGAVTAKPWHSWARKRAEEARHRMLGLVEDEDPAIAKADVQRRKLEEARKQAEQRKKKAKEAEPAP